MRPNVEVNCVRRTLRVLGVQVSNITLEPRYSDWRFWSFLSCSRRTPRQKLKLGNDGFFPYSLQFILSLSTFSPVNFVTFHILSSSFRHFPHSLQFIVTFHILSSSFCHFPHSLQLILSPSTFSPVHSVTFHTLSSSLSLSASSPVHFVTFHILSSSFCHFSHSLQFILSLFAFSPVHSVTFHIFSSSFCH